MCVYCVCVCGGGGGGGGVGKDHCDVGPPVGLRELPW